MNKATVALLLTAIASASEVEVGYSKTETNTVDRTISQFKGKTDYNFNDNKILLKGVYESESGSKSSTAYDFSVLDEYYLSDKFGVYGKFSEFKNTNKQVNTSEKYNLGLLYRYSPNFKTRVGYEVQQKSYFNQEATEQFIKIGFVASYKLVEAVLDRNVRVSSCGSNSTEFDLSMKLYEGDGLFVKTSYHVTKEDNPLFGLQKTEEKTIIGLGYEF